MTLYMGPFSVKITQRFNHRHGVLQETFQTLQNNLRTHGFLSEILNIRFCDCLENTSTLMVISCMCVNQYAVSHLPLLAILLSETLVSCWVIQNYIFTKFSSWAIRVVWSHSTSSHPTPQSTWIAQCIHTVYTASLSHGSGSVALNFRSTSFSPTHAYIEFFFLKGF